MKGTKKIKTRIIAGMLSLVTVFSVGACSVTTASAAGAPSVASIAKDVSNFAIDQVIDKYVTNGIAGSLRKMGTGYLLNWIFDEKENARQLRKYFNDSGVKIYDFSSVPNHFTIK